MSNNKMDESLCKGDLILIALSDSDVSFFCKKQAPPQNP
jgi:hypothetical protein